MANHCNTFVTLQGSVKVLDKIESKLKAYDQTTYFTEFCDYVLGLGKIGEYEKNYAHLINAKPKPNKTIYKNGDKFTDIDMSIPYATYLKYGTRYWNFELIRHQFEGKEYLEINGYTAWSPPIKFIVDLCKKYKISATMNYDEMGMDFAGDLEIQPSGEYIHNEYTANEVNYKNATDWWMDDMIECYDNVEDFKEHFGKEEWLLKEDFDWICSEISAKEKIPTHKL